MEKRFPDAPGVYFFKSTDNKIIYIGKAKSLKNRLNTYFVKNNKDWKVLALLEEHASVEWVLTTTEIEALLLEAQMIKEHQPKYNVLLKNGQPFIYIMFTKADLPVIQLVRSKKDKGTYFGPFLHKNDARQVYYFLKETFKLSMCNKKIANGCLDYHLGRCAGSCKNEFSDQDYKFRVELAIDALSYDHQSFITKLKEKIAEHSKSFEFEKARTLSRYVEGMETIFKTIKVKFDQSKFADQLITVTSPVKSPSQTPESALHLQALLGTPTPVVTVDCFDISHFQSSSIVGSCVRFTNGVPEKNKFRKFKIRSLIEQNDYAALQEIIARRYKNGDIPDLILIDGGKGQLSAARAVMPDAQMISLAKREETIFGAQFPEGKKLDLHNPAGALLIALRDYAHHFAISYHRYRRSSHLKS
ncbi:GIY-YIG nuclease family protein [Vermiphilus pyriformis]|uniref:Excinuclease ABC subunit C n=1 Tax=candidate division TM6 bacterium JCVI TM6SC1 TaxID=1306947 RepID=A0A0D2JEB7_9BACT|nr:hypothetical protein J120_00315 [candidate division TM6 bacterium JCVI TM6SC1]UNE34928.1 MAG: GIY-YIG nuclease family protein [Vermiphilus pyriformis]